MVVTGKSCKSHIIKRVSLAPSRSLPQECHREEVRHDKTIRVYAEIVSSPGARGGRRHATASYGGLWQLRGGHLHTSSSTCDPVQGRDCGGHGLRSELAACHGASVQPARRHRIASQWEDRDSENQPDKRWEF